ncbi:MAG: hypothetical protein U9N14_01035 [Pseudomonadota bacterium]|nr:hypothetical protein [Pseudomonadota bacterium]
MNNDDRNMPCEPDPQDIVNQKDRPKRRGRIPHSAWPSIVRRYNNGETLTGLARNYGCTPSAISYIVKKAEKAAQTSEQQTSQPRSEYQPAETVRRTLKTVRVAGNGPLSVRRFDPHTPPVAHVAEPETPVFHQEPVPQQPIPVAPTPEPEPTPAPILKEGDKSPSEIEIRFVQNAQKCLTAYRAWLCSETDLALSETLGDTMHELRKTLARIEIEMATHRKAENRIRPIVPPTHRANRYR